MSNDDKIDPDYYEVQVTQLWRGRDSRGHILPLHWEITLCTSGTYRNPKGNVYQLIGGTDSFTFDRQANKSIRASQNWRGTFAVGYIPKHKLRGVEYILSNVPITRHDPAWNCQNWVWEALRKLKILGFEIHADLTWTGLQNEMADLLEAWETGDI
ncbi:hypothetical protein EVG20_g4197 [Dentipellis fragilis]|uniref:Uncharacterized protein n=1 Tax=Dentipellis fragilis TaxID=205917 RepID=A0A4Y9YWC8_9AGAM|nr:hypothetical protein EVG20_g4197 [Dentipellis fragilis]